MAPRGKVDDEYDEDDEDGDEVVSPLIAAIRSDPQSRFYDPRYARPITTVQHAGVHPPGGWGDFDASYLERFTRTGARLPPSTCCPRHGATGAHIAPQPAASTTSHSP